MRGRVGCPLPARRKGRGGGKRRRSDSPKKCPPLHAGPLPSAGRGRGPGPPPGPPRFMPGLCPARARFPPGPSLHPGPLPPAGRGARARSPGPLRAEGRRGEGPVPRPGLVICIVSATEKIINAQLAQQK